MERGLRCYASQKLLIFSLESKWICTKLAVEFIRNTDVRWSPPITIEKTQSVHKHMRCFPPLQKVSGRGLRDHYYIEAISVTHAGSWNVHVQCSTRTVYMRSVQADASPVSRYCCIHVYRHVQACTHMYSMPSMFTYNSNNQWMYFDQIISPTVFQHSQLITLLKKEPVQIKFSQSDFIPNLSTNQQV